MPRRGGLFYAARSALPSCREVARRRRTGATSRRRDVDVREGKRAVTSTRDEPGVFAAERAARSRRDSGACGEMCVCVDLPESARVLRERGKFRLRDVRQAATIAKIEAQH